MFSSNSATFNWISKIIEVKEMCFFQLVFKQGAVKREMFSPFDSSAGLYSKLDLWTRISATAEWTVCKDTFEMTLPIQPHEVRCDQPTTAKFLWIETHTGNFWPLQEVRIVESMCLLFVSQC